MAQFMVIVKGDDPDARPSEEILARMGAYNEQLVEAGVMKDGNGLVPSTTGHRITFGVEGVSTVTDGPFVEAKELIAGYWIFECASIEEAVAWARKAPFDEGQQLEIRRVATAEDFGDAYTDEIREQEDRLRTTLGTSA